MLGRKGWVSCEEEEGDGGLRWGVKDERESEGEGGDNGGGGETGGGRGGFLVSKEEMRYKSQLCRPFSAGGV